VIYSNSDFHTNHTAENATSHRYNRKITREDGHLTRETHGVQDGQ
jgi:hypothetical protein